MLFCAHLNVIWAFIHYHYHYHYQKKKKQFNYHYHYHYQKKKKQFNATIIIWQSVPNAISQNILVAFDRVTIFPFNPYLDIRPQAVQCAPYLLRGSARRKMQRPEEVLAFLDLASLGNCHWQCKALTWWKSHSVEECQLCCECRGCVEITISELYLSIQKLYSQTSQTLCNIFILKSCIQFQFFLQTWCRIFAEVCSASDISRAQTHILQFIVAAKLQSQRCWGAETRYDCIEAECKQSHRGRNEGVFWME